MKTKTNTRVASIDILRGLDIFVLTFIGPVLGTFISVTNGLFGPGFQHQLDHVDWEGLVTWDMIMPLFLFTAGLSMPFALSKYVGGPKKDAFKRIIKRVILLYIFGGMVQGNFLDLNVDNIRLFSNTLQSIAVGYLFSALFILYLSNRLQIIVTAALLLIYWAVMTFAGHGDFSKEGNMAELIDRAVLGRYRDGVSFNPDGTWTFAKWYNYTWILSSLNFVATVMTGVFAGKIIKMDKSMAVRLKWLIILGASMILCGYLWGFQMPVIKKIWTSSMVLVTSGISTLLLAFFFYVCEMWGKTKYISWLNIWGTNSIAAYLFADLLHFSNITSPLLYGLEQYTGSYYPFIVMLVNQLIPVGILYLMYKNKIFLRC